MTELRGHGKVYTVVRGNATFRKGDKIKIQPNGDIMCSTVEGWICADEAKMALKGVSYVRYMLLYAVSGVKKMVHFSNDACTTLCGKAITINWTLVNNTVSGTPICKECNKGLK